MSNSNDVSNESLKTEQSSQEESKKVEPQQQNSANEQQQQQQQQHPTLANVTLAPQKSTLGPPPGTFNTTPTSKIGPPPGLLPKPSLGLPPGFVAPVKAPLGLPPGFVAPPTRKLKFHDNIFILNINHDFVFELSFLNMSIFVIFLKNTFFFCNL